MLALQLRVWQPPLQWCLLQQRGQSVQPLQWVQVQMRARQVPEQQALPQPQWGQQGLKQDL